MSTYKKEVSRRFVRTALDALSGRRFVRIALDVLSGPHLRFCQDIVQVVLRDLPKQRPNIFQVVSKD